MFTRSVDESKALNDDPLLPMYDQAIAGMYPPGSTFKIIMSAAGLEEGVINDERHLHVSDKEAEAWGLKDGDMLSVRVPGETPITGAMPTGTGLVHFAARHPDKYFDVGIAEEHAALFACGLASMAATSRLLFAMARDRMLPGSHWLAFVAEGHRAPRHAILFIWAVSSAVVLALPTLKSAGRNIVIPIALVKMRPFLVVRIQRSASAPPERPVPAPRATNGTPSRWRSRGC